MKIPTNYIHTSVLPGILMESAMKRKMYDQELAALHAMDEDIRRNWAWIFSPAKRRSEREIRLESIIDFWHLPDWRLITAPNFLEIFTLSPVGICVIFCKFYTSVEATCSSAAPTAVPHPLLQNFPKMLLPSSISFIFMRQFPRLEIFFFKVDSLSAIGFNVCFHAQGLLSSMPSFHHKAIFFPRSWHPRFCPLIFRFRCPNLQISL